MGELKYRNKEVFGNGVLSESPDLFILWGTQTIIFWIGFATLLLRPISLFDALALAAVIALNAGAVTNGLRLLKTYDVHQLPRKR